MIEQTLARTIELLDSCGIAHMVAGSMASIQYGIPRTTRHIDLVVEMDGASLARLMDQVAGKGFYLPAEAARHAVEHRDSFNLIDEVLGWKADLIVRKDRPFSRSEFARRHPMEIDGVQVFVASVEDTVLSKLEWAALGGSERQLEDVGNVIAVSGHLMDWDYVAHWADELGVSELLARVRSEDH